MNRFFVVLALVVLPFSMAKAGFIIEPYVGFIADNTFEEGSSKQELSGFEFGTRLGFSNFGLSYGLDANSGLMEADDAAGTNVTPTRFGAFLGMSLPVLPRVLLTYYPSSSLKFDYPSVGTADRTYEGSAIRAALLFSPIPFLRLGVEYHVDTFESYETSSGETTLSPEAENKTWLITLSISLP